jgi:hypothetical protein
MNAEIYEKSSWAARASPLQLISLPIQKSFIHVRTVGTLIAATLIYVTYASVSRHH